MAVVREQFAVESALVASHGNVTTVNYDITRPVTTPVEGNTIDFVARPSVRKEFFQGKAFLQLNSVLAVAGTAVRAILILDKNGATVRTVLSVSDNAYLGNGAITADLLKSLLLREDEQTIRLSIHNFSGGALVNTQVTGRFDFGLNAGNYGSFPLVV